ncbi:unnamed protein product [Litomosoides sigmodontis]|uniref:3CxxC-type domain-containing protein n=1 Tax=Litomosoides sigmodontis TaxID=42156 RepID=A0A3P6SNU9_LITSI|nr:unnamed protein product [Litomosoides sigmodontis]
MFEYDRLALDVAEQFAQIRSNAVVNSATQGFDPFRTVSGLCFSPSDSDIPDCGTGSTYGSPETIEIPSVSPAMQVLSFPSHVQQAFCDLVPCNESENVTSLCPTVICHEYSKKSLGSENDENLPSQGAQEDGFSSDEIAQFTQLLCSPKKAPPSKYQCHICYRTGHYISDCPMRFNSPYEELTPYQGRKKCYGEFQCQQCKRKWTSQNSVANEAQSCIKCHISVFPHKQLPVDKAVSMGLVKAQRIIPTKLGPIGHGRPPFNTNRQ